MKVVQYITQNTNEMSVQNIFPIAGDMAGVPVLRTSSMPEADPVIGFGAAITGSSCCLLNSMPEEERRSFLCHIYGDDGIGLSVGRLTIGSSDYSARLYSYDDFPNDSALEHFSISQDEEYIIPMIREILEIRPDLRLCAAPWSPPAWMKTGGSLCGGYMREKYIDCYAEYILRFLHEYEKHGIKIRAVTPQNESETDQNGQMPACIWHPDIEAKFVSVLRKKLRENNSDTEIWIYDHNFSGRRRVMWQLREYPELLADIDGVAFHYYTGSVEMVDILRDEFPNIKLHFTEGGPYLYDRYSDDWCKWGVLTARMLNHGFRSFHGWNLLLDEKGNPNIGPYSCGGFATLNSQSGKIEYSGQYRAWRHFSKFIKPGATVYSCNIMDDGSVLDPFPPTGQPMEVCAAQNPDGSLVLVLVNPNSCKHRIQYSYADCWWQFELPPDSVSTVVFGA